MDSGVATALATAMGDFRDDAVAQVASVLPLAIVLTITVGVLFLGIRLFRAIAHV